MCGERELAELVIAKKRGSSPRVRGTRPRLPPGAHRVRFIPACAGNAPPVCPCARITTVHPRVCGERSRIDKVWPASVGSSPRVRGTRGGTAQQTYWRRFIPACAGNASAPAAGRTQSPVHPRVCGERSASLPMRANNHGSSPRVRGTLAYRQGVASLGRFIPACAGNARRNSSANVLATVHPRVCGERWRRTGVAKVAIGSSPRVRGTRWPEQRRHAGLRFIPACAGNASLRSSALSRRSVHPRVCGERETGDVRHLATRGSSPRVRGTHTVGLQPVNDPRFIPACAGNAWAAGIGVFSGSVHPRVCGERVGANYIAVFMDGSSPRVRGTR